jgi:hypothetical protein
MKSIEGWIAAGIGCLALAACGGGTGGASASAGRDLAEACTSELNMSGAVCECIGETATEELNGRQIRFLLAAVRDEEARAERLREEMGMADATEAGLFLVGAPADCARKLSGEH